MISTNYISEWGNIVPWQEQNQIEQDLIITISLLKLFNNPLLKSKLAFRGGTAINKLFFESSARYSEDIDLVQITAEPIGLTTKLIREALDPFLGKAYGEPKYGTVTLSYRFKSEYGVPMKLKVEINTREHF